MAPLLRRQDISVHFGVSTRIGKEKRNSWIVLHIVSALERWYHGNSHPQTGGKTQKIKSFLKFLPELTRRQRCREKDFTGGFSLALSCCPTLDYRLLKDQSVIGNNDCWHVLILIVYVPLYSSEQEARSSNCVTAGVCLGKHLVLVGNDNIHIVHTGRTQSHSFLICTVPCCCVDALEVYLK